MKEKRISPRRAASILGVHINTVHNWCKNSVDGLPSRLEDVKKTVTGYYLINADEVRKLTKNSKK